MEEGSSQIPPPPSGTMRDDAAVAPALALTRYVALGLRSLARAPMAWTYRALGLPFASFGAIVPTLIGSVFLWLRAMTPEERTEWLSAELALNPELGASRGTQLSVLLVLFFVIPALRGIFDALLYGTIVDGVRGKTRRAATILRESWGAFFGLGMLQLGLVVGAVMFLSPVLAVVARVLDARAGQLGPDLFLVLCVSICMATFASLRALVQLFSAYIAWRPRYFAGAVAAALAAPYAQRSHYVPLYAAWFGAFAVLSLLASLLGATLVPLAVGGAEASEVSGVLLGFVGGTSVVFVSWFESALVAMVGHRLGDVEDGRERAPHSVGLEPPVEGIYGVGEPAPARVSFEELLGYVPSLDPLDGWTLESEALAGTPRVALRPTPAGARELVLLPELSEVTGEEPDEAGVEPGFAGLEAQLARGVLRTGAGGREVTLPAL